MPLTPSGVWSLPRMPLRASAPSCSVPSDLIKTGVPCCSETTMLPRSSRLRTRPMPRTTKP